MMTMSDEHLPRVVLTIMTLLKLVRALEVQARAEVCEAQVALIHLGEHEIGCVILIQSRCQVGTVHCGDFRPRTWQGDDKIS